MFILCYLDIEDIKAVANYINASSPITTGIEGRINIKNTNNEKSNAFNINTQNSQLFTIFMSLFILLIFNVLF